MVWHALVLPSDLYGSSKDYRIERRSMVSYLRSRLYITMEMHIEIRKTWCNKFVLSEPRKLKFIHCESNSKPNIVFTLNESSWIITQSEPLSQVIGNQNSAVPPFDPFIHSWKRRGNIFERTQSSHSQYEFPHIRHI